MSSALSAVCSAQTPTGNAPAAASAPPAVPAVEYVHASIVTDGAAVYGKPDFDSPVQDYLGFQTAVVVSKRPYAGSGGMGLFHKIRYSNKIGYIPDTDIKVSKKDASDEKRNENPRKKNPSKAFDDEDRKRGPGKDPIYMTRYLGGALARVNYTEKFQGHKLSDEMIMYGLRMTGPGTLFDGPPLDFNFWFTVQKPNFYSAFTNLSPSGFMLFGDVQAMFPLIDIDNSIINFGMGVMWLYTHYNVPVRAIASNRVVNFDSQELRLGFDVSAGAGHRFERYLLRGDIKY